MSETNSDPFPGQLRCDVEAVRHDRAGTSALPRVHQLIWTDEVVQRFWSFYADKTHAYFAESFGAEIMRRMAHHLPRGGLCIDFGCGSGGLTAALLGAGYQVAATDYSEEAVARVTQRFTSHPRFLRVAHDGDRRRHHPSRRGLFT